MMTKVALRWQISINLTVLQRAAAKMQEFNNDGTRQIYYNINGHCSLEKKEHIERIILKNAELLNIPVVTTNMF